MKLNILHLSDLHMSQKGLPYLRRVIDGLLRDLKTVEAEHGAKPHLIVLTGDIINKGENADAEFKLVSGELLEPLLGGLGLTQDQLFAIPGNHEINRKKTSEEIELGLDLKFRIRHH